MFFLLAQRRPQIGPSGAPSQVLVARIRDMMLQRAAITDELLLLKYGPRHITTASGPSAAVTPSTASPHRGEGVPSQGSPFRAKEPPPEPRSPPPWVGGCCS